MNALPTYGQGDRGRFDFRVPDGFGLFKYPDWDDPELKVEFRDSAAVLRFTATTASDPALVQGDDYDAEHNPEGGPFVAVDGLDLADFALGVVEARVYARVGGVAVQPYPTILSAFEVAADAGPGPLYSTVDKVRQEAPGEWPESVTDEIVTAAIADASRQVDAYLAEAYFTPWAGINDDPPTPALVERIARKLAAHQCLVWMGRINAAAETGLESEALTELERLAGANGQPPRVRLPGWRGPLAVYRGDLVRGDEAAREDVIS